MRGQGVGAEGAVVAAGVEGGVVAAGVEGGAVDDGVVEVGRVAGAGAAVELDDPLGDDLQHRVEFGLHRGCDRPSVADQPAVIVDPPHRLVFGDVAVGGLDVAQVSRSTEGTWSGRSSSSSGA